VAETNIRLRVDASDAVSQLNRVNGSVKNLSGNFGRLQSAASKFQSVIAGVGIALVAKQAVSAAASFNDLQTRLKLLTSEYGEYEQAQALVARSAKTFGLSNREAAEGITDIFARLRPLGVSLRDIESTFVGFNSVAKLSGVNAVQAGAAFTQLAQALGSGALRGDEFNSIAEQVPGLLTAISQETGVAQGSLRAYAAEGKITSKIVIGALKRVEKEGGDKIKKLIEESDVQKFKDFKDASDALSVSIGQKLLPAITPLIEAATNVVETFAKLPKPIQDSSVAVIALAGVFGILTPAISLASGAVTTMAGGAVIGSAVRGLAAMGEASIAAAAGKNALAASVTAANAKITIATVSAGLLKGALIALPFVAVAGFAYLFVDAIIKANTEQAEFNKVLETGTKKQLEAALAIEKTNLARSRSFQLQGRGEGRAAFQAPIDEAERRIVQLQAQLLGVGVVDPKTTTTPTPTPTLTPTPTGKNVKDISAAVGKDTLKEIIDLTNTQVLAQANLVTARREENNHLRLTLDHGKEFADVTGEVTDLVRNGGLSFTEAFDLVNAGQLLEDQLDKQKDLSNAQAKAAEDLDKIYQSIGDTITTGVVDSLIAAVDGTKSLAEVASNTLRSLANIMLKFGLNTFLGGLGGGDPDNIFTKIFGGKRASGGSVMSSSSYLVGERGPELFTPGRSGSIAPNGALGGGANVVVNVDASGSSAQGDGQQAKQLGSAIGAAVQAELIKQKRPGGLLAS
tara:strand:- start:8940 stop:11165 length:2226 start_codon:yes stop_codon:yes gene_type:complete